MNVSAYEKEADVNRHFYLVHFSSMAKVNYKFAGAHLHHSIELVFCYKGQLKANINRKEIFIDPGDILIINPLDWHFYEFVNDCSCFILVVSKEYFEDLIENDNKEFNNKITVDKRVSDELISMCLKNCDKCDGLTYIQKKAFVLSLFALIEPFGLLRDKQNSENTEVCKKIISYIEQYSKEKLTVGSVAEAFGYSRNYFSYLFNNLIGENFTTFLNKYRASLVLKIKKENPNLNIEEIIYSVGFNSRETYYRLLRKMR